MEHPRHHEIIRPVREIVSHIGQWALDKILPTEIFDDFIQGVQVESAKRTETFSQLTFDSEGNWHNPDGENL